MTHTKTLEILSDEKTINVDFKRRLMDEAHSEKGFV